MVNAFAKVASPVTTVLKNPAQETATTVDAALMVSAFVMMDSQAMTVLKKLVLTTAATMESV